MFNYFMDDRYTFPPARIAAFEDDGYASFCSTDSAEEKDQKEYGKAYLGKLARRRFEAMLRGMTGKRVEIARAMEFALKHAEAADEVGGMSDHTDIRLSRPSARASASTKHPSRGRSPVCI